jgi:hypothetical protein
MTDDEFRQRVFAKVMEMDIPYSPGITEEESFANAMRNMALAVAETMKERDQERRWH